jgi:glycosyltransferase involved in cell wall biosynthesis
MTSRRRPVLVHLTTTDISLELLIGPQLSAFGRAGFEVIAMSAAGPHVAAVESRGVRHIVVEHASRSRALGEDVRACGELWRRFRALRPDIVHTHNPKPGVYGRIAARAARVPVIVNTVHGLYAQPSDPLAKRAIVYGLELIAATCSDAELVQNPEDLATLARIGVSRSKLHELGNGIDLTRFDPSAAQRRRAELRRSMHLAPDDVVCGMVGRLVWEKGYRELFATARVLRGRGRRIRFVVVGERDHAKRDAVPNAAISSAERDGGVLFLGHRNDVDALYAAFDMFVLPSHREGYPRVAMEAAAMALPIVCSNIRGCRQVVDDGRTGVLVPPRDVERLTAAVDALAHDPQRRAAMSQAARAKAVREFDQQRVIDITLKVYDELLGRVRQRHDLARPHH